MSRPHTDKVTVPGIRARKATTGAGERIVALTSYDYPTTRALDAAGVDLILVGDSLGMVVLGHPTTLPVTLEVMLHHTSAVTRARPRALIVADMPFLSYHTGVGDAVRNAGRFVQEAGAEAVKVEGGRARADIVRALVAADIPVMGHLGLTPQSIHTLGGYRVQGKTLPQVEALLDDARALVEAGVFSLVLEAMPSPVARLITRDVPVPTIGIGSGPDCDGQILVIHDLIGFAEGAPPRFVRRYAEVGRAVTQAAETWAADVRSGGFPAERECYPCPPDVREALERAAGEPAR